MLSFENKNEGDNAVSQVAECQKCKAKLRGSGKILRNWFKMVHSESCL